VTAYLVGRANPPASHSISRPAIAQSPSRASWYQAHVLADDMLGPLHAVASPSAGAVPDAFAEPLDALPRLTAPPCVECPGGKPALPAGAAGSNSQAAALLPADRKALCDRVTLRQVPENDAARADIAVLAVWDPNKSRPVGVSAQGPARTSGKTAARKDSCELLALDAQCRSARMEFPA